MRAKKFWIILTLALVASAIWVIGVLADSSIFLPVVIRQATLTPTITPTPTQTATPTATLFPTVTSTPTRTATPTRAAVDINIEEIKNGSTNNNVNDLNDEYIMLVNDGNDDVNLKDWWIRSEFTPKFYTIPNNFTLDPDDTVRIWTKSGTNNNTNLYMGKTEPVWRNSGDCGYLRDDDDNLMDRVCYGSEADRYLPLP